MDGGGNDGDVWRNAMSMAMMVAMMIDDSGGGSDDGDDDDDNGDGDGILFCSIDLYVVGVCLLFVVTQRAHRPCAMHMPTVSEPYVALHWHC